MYGLLVCAPPPRCTSAVLSYSAEYSATAIDTLYSKYSISVGRAIFHTSDHNRTPTPWAAERDCPFRVNSARNALTSSGAVGSYAAPATAMIAAMATPHATRIL